MPIDVFLQAVRAETLSFKEVIAWIETHYAYQPTAFDNGAVHNAAGQNEGSCKVFALAQLLGLTVDDTLRLFAEHYRRVAQTPSGSDHANIRNFMQHGWGGLTLHGQALTPLA